MYMYGYVHAGVYICVHVHTFMCVCGGGGELRDCKS